MKRPAFFRQRPSQAGGKNTLVRRTQLKRIGFIVAALALYSLFQFATTGVVNWPQKLLDGSATDLQGYPVGRDAGWRKAADAIDSLAAKREGQVPPAFDITGRVVRIADGDTISVLDEEQHQHQIRFYGIDAPEKDQPHGEAASETLKNWLQDRNVGVVVIEEDDYGRTVGTVYFRDKNINQAMVAEGHAWWYDHHAPLEQHLRAAQEEAFINKLGLWAGDYPIPPWDWRRGER